MSRENHIYEPDWSGRTDQLCSVNKPVIKKDALALVTGKPVYVDDLAPKDCLIVKVLRSPHANAIVKSVKKTAAERVPGIEAIYTWEDVPKQRFTMAGQTYPEPSGESIYGCGKAGIEKPDFGRVTRHGNHLYFHVYENTVGPLPLPGVKKEEIQAIRYVATGAEIPVSTSWVHSDYPTMAFADLGEDPVLPDGVDTVIDVILKK